MEQRRNSIKLPDEIRAACQRPDPIPAFVPGDKGSTKPTRIARLPKIVDGLNAIALALPEPYHWRFITADAFAQEMHTIIEKGGSAADLNGLYWRDTLSSIEAYTVMAVWRMVDIANGSFALIESDSLVPASILARSALESAIQFVHDARTFAATLDGIMELDLEHVNVSSESLEAFILQTVFASRQTGADPIYKSKNILTIIEKIAKVAKDEPIASEYEILCELTHPNFLGRSVYLTSIEPKARKGDEIRLISHQNGMNAAAVLQSTLWALSWAIEGQATSAHLVQTTIGAMFAKFPFLAERRAG